MNTSKLRLLPSLIAFAVFAVTAQWMLTQPISAQETDTTEEAVVEDINGGEKSIIDMFRAGGWAMYPLTLLSIGGFGLIVYNFMAVRPEPILNTSATVQIDKALEELDIEKVKSICQESPSPTTSIIEAGMARVDENNYDPEQVKEALKNPQQKNYQGPCVN